VTQPDAVRRTYESLIDEALASVDHSATSVTKYRPFEDTLSRLIEIPAEDIYTAYISKAGNVSVRFDQSPRSRSAEVIVALVAPMNDEPVSRSVEALKRQCLKRGPQTEAVVFTRRSGKWRPSTILVPSTQGGLSRPLLQRIVDTWHYVGVLGYIDDGTRVARVHPEKGIRVVALEPREALNAADRPAYPYLELRRDLWDDYTFKTTFIPKLYLTPSRSVDLKEVKILQRGQEGGKTQLPVGVFTQLPSRYCSLGQSYTYYETLKQLPKSLYIAILRGLRDVVYSPRLRAAFESEPGFRRSLARTGSAARALQDAPVMFRKAATNQESLQELRFSFTTNVGGSTFEIDFDFNQSEKLPDRMNAVIGYNGSGKTQLLANLAQVSSSDPSRREEVASRLGQLDYSDSLSFGAVIAVSYSAFDTFALPGTFVRSAERTVARQRLQASGELNGYVYCGLRKRTNDQEIDTLEPRGLKTIDEIVGDFRQALQLSQSPDKISMLLAALSIVSAEPSFGSIGMEAGIADGSDALHDIFDSLSTGHKIVLNMLVQIIGHSQQRSLILIDEPESHLHPSLLAALLRALNFILRRTDSYAVIATHSPVVLQEIPQRYVRVLQRFDQETLVEEPEGETFGANIGYLTTNVFDLDSSQTDYQAVLKELSREMSIDEIDSLFGFGLSSQARALLLSLKNSNERRRSEDS
jgi:ABC-type lipoprotein export system ATPase subunit